MKRRRAGERCIMIAKMRGEQQESTTPPTVFVVDPDKDATKYYEDEVAEIITLPGDMVQAIDMNGDRHDPLKATIVMVSRGSWSVWIERGGETTRYDDVSHVQKNPSGEVVLDVTSNSSRIVGTSIRRAKRTKLLDT